MNEYNINCEIARDLMPLVIDGAASPSARDAVEAHIAGCADCQRAMAAIAREASENLEVPVPAEDTRFIQFSRKLERRFKFQRAAAWLFGIVALLALLAGGARYAWHQMYENTAPLVLASEDVSLYQDPFGAVWFRFEASETHPFVGHTLSASGNAESVYYSPSQPAWPQLFDSTGMTGEIRDTDDMLRLIDGRLMYCEFDAVTTTDRYGNASDAWRMVRATPVQRLWLNDEAHAELLWKAGDPLDLPVIEQARS